MKRMPLEWIAITGCLAVSYFVLQERFDRPGLLSERQADHQFH